MNEEEGPQIEENKDEEEVMLDSISPVPSPEKMPKLMVEPEFYATEFN